MQALSQDEQSARALGLSLLRAHAWPYRSATDGQPDFLASNARLIKVPLFVTVPACWRQVDALHSGNPYAA